MSKESVECMKPFDQQNNDAAVSGDGQILKLLLRGLRFCDIAFIKFRPTILLSTIRMHKHIRVLCIVGIRVSIKSFSRPLC